MLTLSRLRKPSTTQNSSWKDKMDSLPFTACKTVIHWGGKVSVALLVITESFEIICGGDEKKIKAYENAANGLTSPQFSSPSACKVCE